MKIDDVIYKRDENFSESEKRYIKREKLIYNITEDLLLHLENEKISKKELAYKLGRSKSFATQILGGARNMTLRTLSDICHVLGLEPVVTLKKKGFPVGASGVSHVDMRDCPTVVSITSSVSASHLGLQSLSRPTVSKNSKFELKNQA